MTRPRYDHGFATRGRYGNAYPPQFKSVGKPPVRGGRWSVRQKVNGQWRAWTIGQAKRHSRTFYTFDSAIRWATFVSNYYKQMKPKGVGSHDFYIEEQSRRLKRQDAILFIRDRGGSMTNSAINRLIGDTSKGLGLALARQSAINASSLGRSSRH
ncbi:hypothetical protein PBI_TRISCUIT_22 [Microbacterium phage Triscuit]|nr:hypothetical protein PBI_TRISCUIT_22 [Microbacterium phage Triscuit]